MILFLVVAFVGFGDCTGGGVASGYGDYSDLLGNLKNVGGYGVQQYEQQKDYINSYDRDDEKIKGYDYNERNGDKKGRDDDKKDGPGYLENLKGYDDEQKYEGQNDYNSYDNQNKDRYDDKNGDQLAYKRYEDDQKFDKYDGPTDYLVNDKYRDGGKDNRYERNYGRLGSDIREYDYVAKCDYKEKDCKDGRDCYDQSKDRAGYDKCRDQYGNEDRYYDDKDRYSGDRYRYENGRDRFDYDKDCYDNTKDRNDYNSCRQYYRRCREYNRQDYRYSYKEQDWKNNRDCYYDQANLVGLGRNDREDQLIRPCAIDDRQCIRKYFAKNSKCKPAYGPIPDPLYLKRNTVYLPIANITMILTRLRVTGLSSITINEFYVNKDTGNLVLALDFRKLNGTTPRAYFRYKRTAKESIVLSDYATVEYNSGTYTAVIPKIPHLRLDLAEIHADVDDRQPPFFIGPGAYNSTDPDVVTGFARLISNFPTATQELFLFQSQLFTAIYIQENICDFGLKLISV